MTGAARGPITGIDPSAISAEKPARILALDYGRKRIGLALSDELGITAQPLETLMRRNRRDDLRRLREICRRHGVARIVIGHPLRLSGEIGDMAQEAARFAKRVQDDLAIVTELVDERLTSWEAQQTAASNAHANRKNRSSVDSLAAAILLREYLDSKRGQTRLSPARKG